MNTDEEIMTLDEARRLYVQWTGRRAEAARERDRLDRMLGGLDQMINGIATVWPEVAEAPVVREKNGAGGQTDSDARREALLRRIAALRAGEQGRGDSRSRSAVGTVAAVVNNLGQDRWLTVKDIVRQMERGGLLPEAEDPEAAVRVALRRAHHEGLIQRGQRDGRTVQYRSVPAPASTERPAVSAADLSVVSGNTDPQEGGEGDGTGGHRDHDPDQGHRDHSGGAPAVAQRAIL